MAEDGFIEDIGNLTNENFESKMEELKEKYNDEEIKIDKSKKIITIGEKKYNVGDFLKEKENFITEKLKDPKGVSDKEFKEQAENELIILLDIENPVERQIESLSESYKMEYVKRLSIQDMPTEVVKNYFKDIPEQDSQILIGEKIPVLDPQERQEALEKPERKEALEKAVTGITEKNPELKEGFKKIGEMTMDEFNDALDKRQEKTTNIEEKRMCQRMKEYIKEKYNETSFKSIGLFMLLAFLGFEFLNAEMIAGTGCMVTVTNVNTNCRAMDFTIANNGNPSNQCNFPPLCQDPAVELDGSNPKIKCQPNYKENPIKIDGSDICSGFCNSKYLIGTINNNSARYNCEKCDLTCAFTRVFQVICNIAGDLGSVATDIWTFLKKWGFYIIIVVAVVIVVYLITKVIQGAREIKHVLYDTETGSTTTISSHDELATLLANKEITLKPAVKFRSKK